MINLLIVGIIMEGFRIWEQSTVSQHGQPEKYFVDFRFTAT